MQKNIYVQSKAYVFSNCTSKTLFINTIILPKERFKTARCRIIQRAAGRLRIDFLKKRMCIVSRQ